MTRQRVRKAKIFSILVFVIVVLVYFLEEKITVPVPTLKQGEYLRVRSAPIVTGKWSVPYVYDWDSDGRNDLLVGYRMKKHGYVALFRNRGEEDNPELDSPVLLKAGGDYIDLPPEG